MQHTRKSRRDFLKAASAVSAGAAFAPFAFNLASLPAVAQSTGDYRALVYINFSGGNDSHNTVLATDKDSFATYVRYRDTSAVDGNASIALAQSSLLPITDANTSKLNSGRMFSLHPNLVNLQSLFAAKHAAIVANVGPLIVPTTAAQYAAQSVPLPLNLFAHNSQSATWQAFSGEGSRYGWGGRLGDLLLSRNSVGLFTTISTAGNAVFLAGVSAVQLQVGQQGLPGLAGLAAPALFNPYGGEAADSTRAAFQRILARPQQNLFGQDVVAISQRSIQAQATFVQSLKPAYNATTAPGGVASPPAQNNLAAQLQVVLRIMASAFALGVSRQVFYVSIGGFDNHDDEIINHGGLMKEFDDAVGYYFQTATALGLQNKATLFTGSEFGRTITSNGDGSDHGWGAHHFVIGGAVNGGNVYGRFPSIGTNNADNVGSALLPNIAVDQYGATMARWLGASDASLNDVFPNLVNFTQRDLGFMSA